MLAAVQRVKNAEVIIDGKIHSSIGNGLLVLLGIRKGDSEEEVKYISRKLTELRIFSDINDKMNLNVKDTGGEILIISQFTLCADTAKSGNRPSFTNAEIPEKAEFLYEKTKSELAKLYSPEKIKSGVFAAKMDVSLTNSGPVTILIEKKIYE
ncbi:MAG TPA: D-aminoacyl-tRNA deacylase [Ignavibacteria bacterium]|nr:D-aminoacyl-tRNA deacylase [Ignavibacteria bacterium]HRJ99141.1 D-aminoacyl-tRNA deacylase [Ignavibacteria bacterium]